MQMQFEKNVFSKRLKSMLHVDFRRMFTSSLFYLMAAIAFVVPILILVMTTMMDGSVSVNPQTGAETVMEGFDSVWQILGAVSPSAASTVSTTPTASTPAAGAGMGAGMDLVSMCNINMMCFAVAVFVCIFICDDFRSGYAKNLFTVRAKKSDYVISKTLAGFVGSAAMLLAFFVGACIGGGVAGLPFTMNGFNAFNLVCCMLSKIAVCLIFVAVYVLASVIAKQRLWLALILSLGIGMLFFAIVPMVTPLNATPLHVVLCFAGGAMLGVGLGAISNQVLKKTALV